MIAPVRHLVALARCWQGWVILGFVAIQLALPLHYYTTRRDPHDERFAWRMFSPMRMAKCTPTARLDATPLRLDQRFHEAWVELARRGRFAVVEQMAAQLCREHPGQVVSIALDCTYLDGSQRRYGGYDMCNVPLL